MKKNIRVDLYIDELELRQLEFLGALEGWITKNEVIHMLIREKFAPRYKHNKSVHRDILRDLFKSE